MKRFFRDTSWAVHVPRRLQELRVESAKARDHLTNVLDTPPTRLLSRTLGKLRAGLLTEQ